MQISGKVEAEARAVRKDGSIFYKQVVMIKTHNKEEKFIGHYCFTKDITERKRAEEKKLRESENRFRKIFDHSNDAILVIDPKRDEILEVNPRACHMLGFTKEE